MINETDMHAEAPPAGPQPGWVTLNSLRNSAFTGEVVFHSEPEIRVYVDNGVPYFAERATDETLGRRLLDAGLIDAAQLERGTVRVGDVQHLGRLFDRDPSVDRDAVMVVTEESTQRLLSELANDVIATAATTAYRHHPSGVHRWFVAPAESAPTTMPVGEVAQVDHSIVEDLPGLPTAVDADGSDELRIEWDEPVIGGDPEPDAGADAEADLPLDVDPDVADVDLNDEPEFAEPAESVSEPVVAEVEADVTADESVSEVAEVAVAEVQPEGVDTEEVEVVAVDPVEVPPVVEVEGPDTEEVEVVAVDPVEVQAVVEVEGPDTEVVAVEPVEVQAVVEVEGPDTEEVEVVAVEPVEVQAVVEVEGPDTEEVEVVAEQADPMPVDPFAQAPQVVVAPAADPSPEPTVGDDGPLLDIQFAEPVPAIADDEPAAPLLDVELVDAEATRDDVVVEPSEDSPAEPEPMLDVEIDYDDAPAEPVVTSEPEVQLPTLNDLGVATEPEALDETPTVLEATPSTETPKHGFDYQSVASTDVAPAHEATPDPEPAVEVHADPEPAVDARVAPVSEAMADPTPAVEFVTDPDPEPAVDARVAPVPEATPDPEPAVEVHADPEPAVDARVAAVPEAAPDPEPAVEVHADPEPAVDAHVAPVPEAMADPTPVVEVLTEPDPAPAVDAEAAPTPAAEVASRADGVDFSAVAPPAQPDPVVDFAAVAPDAEPTADVDFAAVAPVDEPDPTVDFTAAAPAAEPETDVDFAAVAPVDEPDPTVDFTAAAPVAEPEPVVDFAAVAPPEDADPVVDFAAAAPGVVEGPAPTDDDLADLGEPFHITWPDGTEQEAVAAESAPVSPDDSSDSEADVPPSVAGEVLLGARPTADTSPEQSSTEPAVDPAPETPDPEPVGFEIPALVLPEVPDPDSDVPDDVSNAVLRAIRAIESASSMPAADLDGPSVASTSTGEVAVARAAIPATSDEVVPESQPADAPAAGEQASTIEDVAPAAEDQASTDDDVAPAAEDQMSTDDDVAPAAEGPAVDAEPAVETEPAVEQTAEPTPAPMAFAPPTMETRAEVMYAKAAEEAERAAAEHAEEAEVEVDLADTVDDREPELVTVDASESAPTVAANGSSDAAQAEAPGPRVASVVFVDDEEEPEPDTRAGALRRLIGSLRRK